MKFAFLIHLCVVFTFVAGSQSLENLSLQNPCTTEALKQRKFYHPISADRSSYVQCDAVGTPVLRHCPAHLVWNDPLTTCTAIESIHIGGGAGGLTDLGNTYIGNTAQGGGSDVMIGGNSETLEGRNSSKLNTTLDPEGREVEKLMSSEAGTPSNAIYNYQPYNFRPSSSNVPEQIILPSGDLMTQDNSKNVKPINFFNGMYQYRGEETKQEGSKEGGLSVSFINPWSNPTPPSQRPSNTGIGSSRTPDNISGRSSYLMPSYRNSAIFPMNQFTGKSGLPSWASPGTSVVWQATDNPCLNPAVRFIPRYAEPSRYFECVQGHLMERSCAWNEVWNQTTGTCSPSDSTINYRMCSNAGPLTSPSRRFMPYTGDASKYIECLHDTRSVAVHRCTGASEVWIPAREVCEKPPTSHFIMSRYPPYMTLSLQPSYYQQPMSHYQPQKSSENNDMYNPGGSDYASGMSDGNLNRPQFTGLNPCKTLTGWYFPFPGNPGYFIQCDGAGNMFVQPCPVGLQWNQLLYTCAYASAVDSSQPSGTGDVVDGNSNNDVIYQRWVFSRKSIPYASNAPVYTSL